MAMVQAFIRVAVAAMMLAGCATAAHAKMSVFDSPHNLSTSGGRGRASGLPGVALSGEGRVCVFCHVPHHAVSGTPLWSHKLSPDTVEYKPYRSSTLNANPQPDKPTGASRLCLSCHDGTIALSQYVGSRSMTGTMPNEGTLINPNLTTDLSDDHPISFAYTETLALKSHLASPSTLTGQVRLQPGGSLECTACHDPHDNLYGNFLVVNNGDSSRPDYTGGAALCVTCHRPVNWENAGHNPAQTPSLAKSCLNCHAVHNAPGPVRLLTGARPEDTCLQSCHNGSDASSGNIKALLDNGLHRHPMTDTGSDLVHDENESLPAQKYHVQCVDCHNPHQANKTDAPLANPPRINGQLQGVRIDSLGNEATTEYQVCFKCHGGDYASRFSGVTEIVPNRMIAEPNQVNRFDSLNPSFHPVTADRRGTGASLLTTLQPTMLRIYCSDCHGSDQSKKAGGLGPNGPHGSRYEHILVAQYYMPAASTSVLPYNSAQYSLCYRCHLEEFVMNSGSAFTSGPVGGRVNEHASHVRDRQIPCFACHDPHGVPWKFQATVQNNSHLINFDKSWAAGTAVNTPVYTRTGPGEGSCLTNCHTTVDHIQSYSATGSVGKRLRPKGLKLLH